MKEDKSVTVTPVKLGPVQGEITAIASGLTPGDVVVVDGADKLREGAKVELITRDAQTGRRKAPVARVPDAATGRRAAERALATAAVPPAAPLPALLPPAGRRPAKTADDSQSPHA